MSAKPLIYKKGIEKQTGAIKHLNAEYAKTMAKIITKDSPTKTEQDPKGNKERLMRKMKKKIQNEFERELNIEMAEKFLADQGKKKASQPKDASASHDLAYGNLTLQERPKDTQNVKKVNDASSKLDQFMKRKNLPLSASDDAQNKLMRINQNLYQDSMAAKGSQGSQKLHKDQDGLTKKVFTEDWILRKKDRTQNPMETVMEREEDEVPETQGGRVRWSFDKVSGESTDQRKLGQRDQQIKGDHALRIKSTTEMNIVLQHKLGQATVDDLLGYRKSELAPHKLAQIVIQDSRAVKAKQLQLQKRASSKSNVTRKSQSKPSNKPSSDTHKYADNAMTIVRQTSGESLTNTVLSRTSQDDSSFSSTIKSAMNRGSMKRSSKMVMAANQSNQSESRDLSPNEVHLGLQRMEKQIRAQTKPQLPDRSALLNSSINSSDLPQVRSNDRGSLKSVNKSNYQNVAVKGKNRSSHRVKRQSDYYTEASEPYGAKMINQNFSIVKPVLGGKTRSKQISVNTSQQSSLMGWDGGTSRGRTLDTFEVNIVDDKEAKLLMKNVASHQASNVSVESRTSSLPALFKNSASNIVTPNTFSKQNSSRHDLNYKSSGYISFNEEKALTIQVGPDVRKNGVQRADNSTRRTRNKQDRTPGSVTYDSAIAGGMFFQSNVNTPVQIAKAARFGHLPLKHQRSTTIEASRRIPTSQAQLFAMATGLDTVISEQDKDERYGRVVRDYQLLSANKQRMKSLISLLANERQVSDEGTVNNGEQADVQKSQMRIDQGSSMGDLSTKLPAIRKNPVQLSVTNGAQSTQVFTEALNQARDDSQYDENGNKVHILDLSAAAPLSLIDPENDYMSSDQNRNRNRSRGGEVLSQQNFKYFLNAPHIPLYNNPNKKLHKAMSFRRNERGSLGSQSASDLNAMQVIEQSPSPKSFQGDVSPSKDMRMGAQPLGDIPKNYSQLQIGNRYDRGSKGRLNESEHYQGMNLDHNNLAELRGHGLEPEKQSYSALSQKLKNLGYPAASKSPVFIFDDNSSVEGLSQNMMSQNDYAIKFSQKDELARQARSKLQQIKGHARPRIESHHGQNGRNVHAKVAYQKSLTYVMVNGKAKPTQQYINQSLPYGEMLLSQSHLVAIRQANMGRQSQAMRISDNKSPLDYKSGHTPMHINRNGKQISGERSMLPASLQHVAPGSNKSALSNKAGQKKRLASISPRSIAGASSLDQDQNAGNEKRKKQKKSTSLSHATKDQLAIGGPNAAGAKAGQQDQAAMIMEMSEEGSDFSGRLETDGQAQVNEQMRQTTWQDLYEENEQLKQQISSQIMIFEQYLKVALLQQKQKEIEMARKEQQLKKGIFDGMEVIIDQGKNGIESTHDYNGRRKQRTKSHAANHQTQRLGSFSPDKNVKKALKSSQSIGVMSAGSGASHAGRRGRTRISSAGSNPQTRSISKLRQGSASKGGRVRYATEIKVINRAGSARSNKSHKSNRRLNDEPFQAVGHNNAKSQMRTIQALDQASQARKSQKPSVMSRFMRQITTVKQSALTAFSKLGKPQHDLRIDVHKTHQIWLDRIQEMWTLLEQQKNSECIRIETQIRLNKRKIHELTRDNIFELEVGTSDQKMLLRAKFNQSKMKKALRQTKEERQLRKLQKKWRNAIEKSKEFNTWGLQNYLIVYQIKCRMTEDIIDLAQRVHIKPDKLLERKMRKLKRLRKQTWDDLDYFVVEREKKHWRNWDHRFMGNWKPDLDQRAKYLASLRDGIDRTLMIIEFMEARSGDLQNDIAAFNEINGYSIVTVTQVFGHEHWLSFWQLKQLRKQQGKRANQYDPDAEQLEALKDHVKNEKYRLTKSMKLNKDSGAKKGWASIKSGKPSKEAKDAQEKMKDEDMRPRMTATELQEGLRVHQSSADELDPEDVIAGDVVDQVQDQRQDQDQDKDGSIESPGSFTQVQNKADSKDGALAKTVATEDKQAMAIQDNPAKEEKPQFKSKWMRALDAEKKAKQDREKADRKARVARLAELFDKQGDDESDGQNDIEMDDIIERVAISNKMQDYISKIDTHLKVELALLEDLREESDKEDEKSPEQAVTQK